MGKLNSARLRTLTKAGVYGDGDGLYLQVRDADHRTWIYRFTLRGKARWMGLGAFPQVVSLAEAREAAAAARKLVRQGVDPIEHRRSEEAAAAPSTSLKTFSDAASAYITAHGTSWRNPKHRQQWHNTLATYVAPTMGRLPVAAIDTDNVTKILVPIWTAKPETASRVRGRVEAILDYAKVQGWRDGENPARWRGHLAILLPSSSKVARVRHHPALPWRQIASFMGALLQEDGVAALALRFAILTAARTGEVIRARWSEIDMDAGLWTISEKRMKAKREHRVPLLPGALSILREAEKLRYQQQVDAFIFPGAKANKPLSSMAMLMLLRRMDRGDLTVHGFRSTFRDWCAEHTDHPGALAEMALTHTLRDKTEAAYLRSDLLDKRRGLMSDWAAFCGLGEGGEPGAPPDHASQTDAELRVSGVSGVASASEA